MAQLKDLLVSGPSRFIGKLFANDVQLTTLNIPTTSGGTTYGPGTNGQYLRTNGTSVYWESIANTGSATQGVYFSNGKPVALSYVLQASINSSTAGRIAYYSGNNAISGASANSSGLTYTTANSTASTPGTQTRFRVWGPTYGNTAANLISGTAGLFSFGDGGPQISFGTTEAAGGSQDGALIFTDHDSAAAGASWHFVSNQTDWNVTSKRFHARTSISIGQNFPNTSYNLYVNGTTYLNGNTTINGNLLFGGVNYIHWNNGTYQQRIFLTDDSTADTAVFTFQQSANSGSSWSDLLIIKDNGTSIMTGGLEVRGHIAGDSGTAGHGLYSGGGYHNAYNNIILHGDNTSGSSGIAFVSDKVSNGVTIANVNQPSDRAFIQYHACGITTATAEGTAPTLATSGEAGRLVIGVGNDATDQVWLQAPSHTNLIHQIGASSYVIPDTGNTTGTVGGTDTPVYVSGGVITSLAGKKLANSISGNAASATKATQDGSGNNIVSTYLNKTIDGTMQGNLTMASGKKFIGNLQGNADTATTATTATKATQDGDGNNIANTYLKKSGGDMTGTLKLKGLKGTASTDYGETLPTSPTEGQIFFQISSEQYELPAGGATGTLLMKASASNYDVQWTPAAVYVSGSVLYGAAWNDYAEFRSTTGKIEPGRVVIENGNDTLSLSTERLQGGAEIVSDTFGFAIGQTEKCNTPIAASGRVLAYPNEPRDTYKPGQPVCSGPNGTVSQMTDEEARNYPWLIIGTVSAIPDYKTWGEDNIEVKGRIWVRIR